MEKVIFTDPDTKEKIEFYVLEETQINGKKFLFVTEEEDGDSEAYILKEIADENDDVVYEMVEDDNELAALGKVFAELMLRQRRNLHADRHERIQQPERRKQTRQQGKKKKAERLKRKPEQRRKQKVRLQRL